MEQKEINYGQDSFGYRMLIKQGFVDGKGLGRDLQGRSDPIEPERKKSRKGLGYESNRSYFTDAEDYMLEYAWSKDNDYSEEELYNGDLISHFRNEDPYDLDEVLFDIPNDENSYLSLKKILVGAEVPFCDFNLMSSILYFKDSLDKVEDVRGARSRCNPYEKIGRGIFLNRAAMKMANIDYITDGQLTSIVPNNEILCFADVCAGPGGFSEYVLWRRCYQPLKPAGDKIVMPARGFGLTLINDKANPFMVEKFFAGPCEAFKDLSNFKKGDITNSEVHERFCKSISEYTDEKGVHLFMADGGYDVSADYNQQEILSHQLYLCQCLTGLMVLRPGGNFVTKLFDIFTEFSVQLIYIMSLCFEKISLIKPVTSRPANSERYLFCRNLKHTTDSMAGFPEKGCKKSDNLSRIIQYLTAMNDIINVNSKKKEVNYLLKMEPFHKSKQFISFIRLFNEEFARRQIREISRIPSFYDDPKLTEDRQVEVANKYLDKWGIPSVQSLENSKTKMENHWPYYMNKRDKANFFKLIHNIPDKKFEDEFLSCFESLSNLCAIWYPKNKESMNITTIFSDHKKSKTINPPREELLGLSIPPQTLIHGLYVNEYRIAKGQRVPIFWIIDAAWINGEDVTENTYLERMKKVKQMVNAMIEQTRVKLRSMEPMDLLEAKVHFKNLTFGKCKDFPNNQMFLYPQDIMFNSGKPNIQMPVDGLIICDKYDKYSSTIYQVLYKAKLEKENSNCDNP